MTNDRESDRTRNRAYEGDATPMRPEEPSLGPTERAIGETPAIAVQPSDGRTVADGERPAVERRGQGIEDNVRHTDSIGRR